VIAKILTILFLVGLDLNKKTMEIEEQNNQLARRGSK